MIYLIINATAPFMHSTQKSVIINKAICRFKHEEKEDEFHAKRMESIQPLKWQE